MSRATMNRQSKGEKDFLARLGPCAYCELLGIEIAATEKGYARLTMPVDGKLFQPYGIVHGGAIASLADSAAGVAFLTTSERDTQPVTLELKLNFISPASKGTLVAEARLFHSGRTTAVADVEVCDEDGRLIAKGIATFLSLRR